MTRHIGIHLRIFRSTVTYSPGEMEKTLADAGCTRIRHHAMQEMERLRTGTNRYSPAGDDGWIQISTGML